MFRVRLRKPGKTNCGQVVYKEDVCEHAYFVCERSLFKSLPGRPVRRVALRRQDNCNIQQFN